ncbi:hypothetical protein MPL1_09552 [Methylophaga lonarensis MPL]|uniref:Plasmid partition ParA protein n=1 Tax=Methylophaga lonarensis MPL TaxID=1286106 RepID=M7NZC6_9GAMM|nr:DUF1365 domain-containing protein [Methylophaga lonarensis]EMR12587.1 hypothetical protein MPL1_09552 [Methylophaga lonarensis MPL]
MLADGIYQGTVWHQRFQPKVHGFEYPLAMLLFDVDQLEAIFRKSRWWSINRFNLIGFVRDDYIGDASLSIKQAVAERIWQSCQQRFSGSVKILTHPRYAGFVFNPVSFYFCYEQQQLKFIVAEINNTPWNERFSYVLPVQDGSEEQLFEFDKQFHVSPFMPMQLRYRWRFRMQPQHLDIHMTLFKDQQKQFEAAMKGSAQAFTQQSMRRLPWQYPLQTLRVVMRIYWHALRLKLKGVPFYNHPGKSNSTDNATGEQ